MSSVGALGMAVMRQRGRQTPATTVRGRIGRSSKEKKVARQSKAGRAHSRRGVLTRRPIGATRPSHPIPARDAASQTCAASSAAGRTRRRPVRAAHANTTGPPAPPWPFVIPAQHARPMGPTPANANARRSRRKEAAAAHDPRAVPRRCTPDRVPCRPPPPPPVRRQTPARAGGAPHRCRTAAVPPRRGGHGGGCGAAAAPRAATAHRTRVQPGRPARPQGDAPPAAAATVHRRRGRQSAPQRCARGARASAVDDARPEP